MYYFTYILNELKPKNKLQEEIQDLLKRHERKVLYASEAKKLQRDIMKDIEYLNSVHKRCAPVNAQWYEMQDDQLDIFLHGVEGISFVFLKSK